MTVHLILDQYFTENKQIVEKHVLSLMVGVSCPVCKQNEKFEVRGTAIKDHPTSHNYARYVERVEVGMIRCLSCGVFFLPLSIS